VVVVVAVVLVKPRRAVLPRIDHVVWPVHEDVAVELVARHQLAPPRQHRGVAYHAPAHPGPERNAAPGKKIAFYSDHMEGGILKMGGKLANATHQLWSR